MGRTYRKLSVHFPGEDPGTYRCGQHTRNKGKTAHLKITENVERVTCKLCIKRLKEDFTVGYDENLDPVKVKPGKNNVPTHDYDISNPSKAAVRRAERLGKMLKQQIYDKWDRPKGERK